MNKEADGCDNSESNEEINLVTAPEIEIPVLPTLDDIDNFKEVKKFCTFWKAQHV